MRARRTVVLLTLALFLLPADRVPPAATYPSWTPAAPGVTVDLSLNTAANDGFGDTDTFVNLAGVFGSAFADMRLA